MKKEQKLTKALQRYSLQEYIDAINDVLGYDICTQNRERKTKYVIPRLVFSKLCYEGHIDIAIIASTLNCNRSTVYQKIYNFNSDASFNLNITLLYNEVIEKLNNLKVIVCNQKRITFAKHK
mgnify:CR=1 FL=1